MVLSTRPLTPEERKSLAPRRDNRGVGYCVFFVGTLGGSAGYAIGDRLFQSKDAAIILALLVPIALGFWIYRMMTANSANEWLKNREKLRGMDLADGIVQVRSYVAVNAINVKEFEDEGDHYFLHLDDGSVLFLSGQYLYNSEEEKMSFPCTEFDVVVAPHSKIVFELVRRGSYLPPSKTLKPFRKEQYQTGKIPKDSDLVKIRWNEIEALYSPEIVPKKGKSQRRS